MEQRWKNPNFWIREEDYEEKMNTVVADFLRNNVKEGDYNAKDGKRLHYYYAKRDNAIANVVVCHGFCEFVRKYDEILYYFYELGYSVFFPEYRDHGQSERVNGVNKPVYVDKFDSYSKDLEVFVDKIVLPKADGRKLFLFSHSMGGAVATYYMAKHPKVFSGAVLSAPMVDILYGGHAKLAVGTMVRLGCLFGKKYDYVPGAHAFREQYDYEGSNALSVKRYEHMYYARMEHLEYRTSGAAYGWTKAVLPVKRTMYKLAPQIQTPVYVFQALGDTLVDLAAQDRFMERLPNAKICRVKDSKHEIFHAKTKVREEYFVQVFTFFEALL